MFRKFFALFLFYVEYANFINYYFLRNLNLASQILHIFFLFYQKKKQGYCIEIYIQHILKMSSIHTLSICRTIFHGAIALFIYQYNYSFMILLFPSLFLLEIFQYILLIHRIQKVPVSLIPGTLLQWNRIAPYCPLLSLHFLHFLEMCL